MENINYEFKDMATIDVVESVSESAHVLIENNGSIERMLISEIGGGAATWDELENKPFGDTSSYLSIEYFPKQMDVSSNTSKFVHTPENSEELGKKLVADFDKIGIKLNKTTNGTVKDLKIVSNAKLTYIMNGISVDSNVALNNCGYMIQQVGENAFEFNITDIDFSNMPVYGFILYFTDGEVSSMQNVLYNYWASGAWDGKYITDAKYTNYGYVASSDNGDTGWLGEKYVFESEIFYVKQLDEKFIPRPYEIITPDTHSQYYDSGTPICDLRLLPTQKAYLVSAARLKYGDNSDDCIDCGTTRHNYQGTFLITRDASGCVYFLSTAIHFSGNSMYEVYRVYMTNNEYSSMEYKSLSTS